MTHETLEGDEVADETVCESVSELVGSARLRACKSVVSGLSASRVLGILPPALSLAFVDPHFDFHREDMIVRCRLQLAVAIPQLEKDVWIDREPPPVLPFTEYVDSPTKQIDVFPPAGDDLRPPETHAFHEENRRPLGSGSSVPHPS